MKDSLPSPLTPGALVEFRKSLEISQRLFGIRLAFVNSMPIPFTRGFISNLENGQQMITIDMERAIQNYHKQIKAGTSVPFIDGAIQHHPQVVKPGSLFAGQSKDCKWDDCKTSFIRTAPNQKQCPECKRRRRRS